MTEPSIPAMNELEVTNALSLVAQGNLNDQIAAGAVLAKAHAALRNAGAFAITIASFLAIGWSCWYWAVH